jgi:DNA replication protein DnaC
LGKILDTLGERVALGEEQAMSFGGILLSLLTDEIQRRDSGAASRHADKAGLDSDMVIERWDKTAKVHFDRRLFQELVSLDSSNPNATSSCSDPVGVGKTFPACALGQLACRAGFHVRFHRADALLRLLRQSRMDNSREALLTELCTIELLIIDDFALEPMTHDESRDVYQLFVERIRAPRPSSPATAIPAEWLTVFDDTLLAAKCGRSLSQQRLRPRHRRRVVPIAHQAHARRRPSSPRDAHPEAPLRATAKMVT